MITRLDENLKAAEMSFTHSFVTEFWLETVSKRIHFYFIME